MKHDHPICLQSNANEMTNVINDFFAGSWPHLVRGPPTSVTSKGDGCHLFQPAGRDVQLAWEVGERTFVALQLDGLLKSKVFFHFTATE